MDTDTHRLNIDEVTEKIIGCAFKVSTALGVGFLEKVYENALFHELTKTELKVRQQASLQVRYDGIIVGDYFVDLLVEDTVIVELKHSKNLDPTHLAQCLNYLKATNLRVGLLLNFWQPSLQIKRVVHN